MEPLRAAGGVTARDHPERGLEVVLVHRPRFDDWSLPKGKLKRGEHPLVGAVREVREETGLSTDIGARLPTVHYDVWSGDELVEKVVDYWAMTVAADHGFVPDAEVDAIAWLGVEDALERLSYPHDKRVMRAFSELPRLLRPVVLIRHASAGERSQWPGSDEQRPLDPTGEDRAAELAQILACFGPTRLVSARPVRCAQTLQPLATASGLSIELDSSFDENAEIDVAAARLRSLADSGGCVVVCSQGGLIPPVLARLNRATPPRYRTAKGAGWALSFAGNNLAALDAIA
jgi:8-oxo-dGTP diphosphatase